MLHISPEGFIRRSMRYILWVVVTILLASCSTGSKESKLSSQLPEQAAAKPTEAPEPAATATQVEMVNVNIHLDPQLILHIRHLTGKFIPTQKGQPPTFDDNRSYIVEIDSGEVGVSMASMTHAMNTYVFGEPDAPLKNLQLSSEGSALACRCCRQTSEDGQKWPTIYSYRIGLGENKSHYVDEGRRLGQ